MLVDAEIRLSCPAVVILDGMQRRKERIDARFGLDGWCRSGWFVNVCGEIIDGEHLLLLCGDILIRPA